MQVLIAGLVAAVILMFLPQFIGRRQDRMLKQYAVLEKCFGLSRRVSSTRWGKGIGEHHSLHGEIRGYPVSLYYHFVGKGKSRLGWTSLVFEALFANDLELCIDFPGTEDVSSFSNSHERSLIHDLEGVRVRSNCEALLPLLANESLANRFRAFASKPVCGSIRLSKGFLEYRESGGMETEEQRLRFQEAAILLGTFCDALSLFVSERKDSELVAQF